MPAVNGITLENFRCFREEQKARLAPLTLLVGENSTGKTSLLALIRAMREFVFQGRPPNFKASPYDLGSYSEIAHHRGGRGSRANSFTASISIEVPQLSYLRTRRFNANVLVQFEAIFREQGYGSAPIPVRQHIAADGIGAWIEDSIEEDGFYIAHVKTERGEWELRIARNSRYPSDLGDYRFYFSANRTQGNFYDDDEIEIKPIGHSLEFNEQDEGALRVFGRLGAQGQQFYNRRIFRTESFASAPVRSRPLRTYDPGPSERAPEGEHVPMRIAELSSDQSDDWSTLKDRLEDFGKTSGLFDEIDIRQLGKNSDPFQVQVRKGSRRLKGPFRNLIDVGYGVSQVLPIVTELMMPSAPTDLYLIQQPEVHLHPSAQAALGTLFCEIAAKGQQLIVETHSDHLMDRIRMDVRDAKSELKPDDVSLLYFEREGLDVKIRSLCFDENGNVLGAPSNYRRFFLEEVNRSLGI